jgi:energy-coupling factor transporter transmembrane protein EcfT
VAAIGTTVVTHHVTSYVLVAALALVTVAALLVRNWRTAAWAAVLALLSGAATAAWLALAAPQTWDYLQPFAAETLQSLQVLLAGGHASVAPVSAGPLTDRALSDAAVLAVSVLLPIGWWQVWRRHRLQPWAVAMAIGSAGWYATVAIRLLAADSSELAGRSASFVFVPAAYIAALAVGRVAGAAVRRHTRAASVAMLVVVLMLMFNGLANGWPPYWERLPGAYQVAGAERAVEPQVIGSAVWTLAELGPGNRFATDIGSYPVLGSYGDQNPVRDVAYLYTSPRYTQADASRSSQQALRYVWVDQRLSTSLPASGQYFPVDPGAGKYEHPLSPADTGKFNRVPGVDRIYDAGDIVIYRLPGPER